MLTLEPHVRAAIAASLRAAAARPLRSVRPDKPAAVPAARRTRSITLDTIFDAGSVTKAVPTTSAATDEPAGARGQNSQVGW